MKIQLFSYFILIYLTTFNSNASSSFFGFYTGNKQNVYDSKFERSFSKRDSSTLSVGLVSYGSDLDEENLKNLAEKLKTAFFLATEGEISLDFKLIKHINFKDRTKTIQNFRYNSIEDTSRLHRIWYYEKSNYVSIVEEAHNKIKENIDKSKIRKLDLVLLATGAQFEGLGVNVGRYAVVETPRELAFGSDDGGSVVHLSDETLIDEFIHEIGHAIGMNHAAHCEDGKCCETSDSADDVMSYCRDRSQVNHGHFYKFEQCHMNYIRETVKPTLLNGGDLNLGQSPVCE